MARSLHSCLYEVDKTERVAVITFKSPPVNALSYGVRKGLYDGLNLAVADESVDAIILRGDGGVFCAGADISEFSSGNSTKEPVLSQVLTLMDSIQKPIVAAIHGLAFGGGLEVALTAHYRVASNRAKLGLPEVKLGLLPGAGGTQRLPRLVGIHQAVKMITQGVPIGAIQAKKLGVVDEVSSAPNTSAAILDAAIAFFKGNRLHSRRTRDIPSPTLSVEEAKIMEGAVIGGARGFEAPVACFYAVKASTLPFDQGIKEEQRLFMKLFTGTQAKAQQYQFFAQRTAGKPRLSKHAEAAPVKSVGVVGAGTMGTGIALCFLLAGIPVVLNDTTDDAIKRGVAKIKATLSGSVQKGRLSEEKAREVFSLVTPSLSFDGFKNVDMVIEAVFENMDIKKQVFGRLDKICKSSALLCSNTSTLDIDEMASATSRPQQFIGTHFFSPANVMKLLEIVKGQDTSDSTILSVLNIGKRIGKVAVVVGNCDGFVGNRMLHGYGLEAIFMAEEGADVAQVDRALEKWGMAMGPLRMGDLAGLDVGYRIRQGKAATRDPNERYPYVADKLCEAKRFGQKTGKGWYRYEASNPRKALPDPEVQQLIRSSAEARGVKQRSFTDQEIVERTIFALINEGFKCLEEGIASRPSDIDVIYAFGYGFPVHRGGPMFYCDTVGVAYVCKRVEEFHRSFPTSSYWKPSALLQTIGRKNMPLAEYWKTRGTSSKL